MKLSKIMSVSFCVVFALAIVALFYSIILFKPSNAPIENQIYMMCVLVLLVAFLGLIAFPIELIRRAADRYERDIASKKERIEEKTNQIRFTYEFAAMSAEDVISKIGNISMLIDKQFYVNAEAGRLSIPAEYIKELVSAHRTKLETELKEVKTSVTKPRVIDAVEKTISFLTFGKLSFV